MNPLQQKTFDYLTSGSGNVVERKTALASLINRGAFGAIAVNNTKMAINSYLNHNPDGLCPAGIERFKKEVLTPEHNSSKELLITLTVPIFGWSGKGYDHDDLGHTSGQDCGTVQGVMDAVKGYKAENFQGLWTFEFGTPKWTEYKIQDRSK